MGKLLDVAKSVIAAFDERDFDRLIGHLCDDIEYHYHVGSEALHGKESVRLFLELYDEGKSQISWRLLNSAETAAG